MICSTCDNQLSTLNEQLDEQCQECVNRFATESAKDAVRGDALKNQAIGRVLEAAPADWLGTALQAVFWAASRNERFTTDEVWAFEELGQPPEPRAMGAVMKVAEKSGWIEPTRDHRLSRRPVCHRRPLRVWQSRLQGLGGT